MKIKDMGLDYDILEGRRFILYRTFLNKNIKKLNTLGFKKSKKQAAAITPEMEKTNFGRHGSGNPA